MRSEDTREEVRMSQGRDDHREGSEYHCEGESNPQGSVDHREDDRVHEVVRILQRHKDHDERVGIFARRGRFLGEEDPREEITIVVSRWDLAGAGRKLLN